MAKILPITVAVGCALFALLSYLSDWPVVDGWAAILAEGALILVAFALLLGVLNLAAVHARRIAADRAQRPYAAMLLMALVVTGAIGVWAPDGAALAWILEYLYRPLQASMTALLAFFIVTAAYRVFHLRNLDAAILLTVACLMLVAQLPVVGHWLPRVRDWLVQVPVTAGMRGLLLGASLGAMATALRVLLAIDRPYLGE